MKITLKDGSVKEYEHSMSVIDIAKDLSEGLARVATSGRVNGELVDLRTVVDSDSEVEILTFDNEEGKGAFFHTTSHIRRLRKSSKMAEPVHKTRSSGLQGQAVMSRRWS